MDGFCSIGEGYNIHYTRYIFSVILQWIEKKVVLLQTKSKRTIMKSELMGGYNYEE